VTFTRWYTKTPGARPVSVRLFDITKVFCTFHIQLISYMKYLLTILILSLVACDKDEAPQKPVSDPPSIVKVQTLSPVMDIVPSAQPGKNDTFYRPQLEVTLNVPDSSTVSRLSIYVKASFPYYKPVEIVNPKTGVYTVVDMSNVYPASGAKRIYFSVFTMKDFSYITNSDFSIN
jgi:hypothetical protein